MSEPVIYMKGVSFGPTIPFSKSLLDDVALLSTFDQQNFDALIAELETHDGFMDQHTLSKLINVYLKDEDKSKKVARFVDLIHENIRKSSRPLDGFLDDLKAWNEEQPQKMEIDQLESACNRAARILKSFPCYMRQAKAERLMSLIGRPLESIDLVCDIRPVFSEDRTEIEGMFPYAWLKLVATEQSGLPSSFETVLSMSDLELFKEAIDKAKMKVEELTRVIRRDSRLASTKLPSRKRTE